MSEKISFWKSPKRLLESIKHQKGLMTISALRSIFYAIQGSIVALSMKHIIDSVSNNQLDIAFKRIIIMGILFLIADVPAYFFRNVDNKIWIGITSYLYKKSLTHFVQGDNNKIESLGTGKTQSIINGGINAQNRVAVGLFTDVFNIAVSLVFSVILISTTLGWKASLVFFVILLVTFFLVQLANKSVALLRKQKRELFIENDRNIIKIIMSKFEVLQNGKLRKENAKIQSSYDEIYKLQKIESKKNILRFDLQRIMFSIMRIAMLAYVIINVPKGIYTLGDVALIWTVVNQAFGLIRNLNDYMTSLHQENVNITRLWDLFDEIKPIKGYETGEELSISEGNINISNITYSYGTVDVLKDFSLEIQGGKKTALVGISGSGKTTIIKLIAGYIHPQEGEVLIDNQSLPNDTNTKFVSLKSYYKHIGYLTQEPNVFDGTIYENLTYALDSEPSNEQIEAAIQGAQCQFIHEFPEGVQTEIGEKGIKLSGGQRQRLAIAKVMLKNPSIILLDEPTSALDSFSEEEVTRALNNLFEGRTVIIIAHRLQTVKKADRIIVLDHGKVVEDGNHDSLVKSGGVYAKMLELQSGF